MSAADGHPATAKGLSAENTVSPSILPVYCVGTFFRLQYIHPSPGGSDASTVTIRAMEATKNVMQGGYAISEAGPGIMLAPGQKEPGFAAGKLFATVSCPHLPCLRVGENLTRSNPTSMPFAWPLFDLLFLAVFPARNPKSKVPRSGEHCQGGGSGRRGARLLTGADGLHNERSDSRQNDQKYQNDNFSYMLLIHIRLHNSCRVPRKGFPVAHIDRHLECRFD
jgi:hypothetical protein